MIIGYVRAMSKTEINKNIVVDLANKIKNKYSCAEIINDDFNSDFNKLNNLVCNLNINDVVVVNGLERLGRNIEESINYILSIVETGAEVHILDYININKKNYNEVVRIIKMTEHARNEMYRERRSLSTINSKSASRKKQGKPRADLDSEQVYNLLNNYTQQQVADMIGVSRSTITRFLRKDKI